MYVSKIKEIRKKLGLSVPKLAERINIPARTIVSYESGRTPSLEFLAQLCTVYDINANWFITGQGEMFIKDIKEEKSVVKIDKDEFRELFKECMKEYEYLNA